MPEWVHNTNAEFDLRYSEKDAIKLEPYLHTCIDLKPNEKIAQAIFLPLVKIAQLVSVENRKELGITAKEIQRFRFTDRIDIPYMITIEKKVKDQVQIFEAEAQLCKLGEIGLINLHIPAKNHSHIKIFIYNNTENIMEISEETTIGYLTIEIKEQQPNLIPNFSQLCRYVDITSQTIYGQEKYYLLQSEQLEQINLGNLDPLQHIQLKMLLNNFNNIFTSKNKFVRIDIIQYQIKPGDAMPIKHWTIINYHITTNIQELRRDQKPLVTFSTLPQKQHSKNNFKVVTTPDTTTLEYYQSIYTHCKQRFNIPDGIEVVKESVYQYIENHINNYLFGNYNISEVRSNLYNNLVHYSQLETEDLNSKTLATYFQELNFNIIKYCEETYPVQSQYSIDFESETKTSNKDKQKLKQYSKTTPNTSILPKTTAKHLQTSEQRTSSKLPLTITPFPALLVQAQTLNSPLNQFARLEDFTSSRSPTRQQKPLQTSSNLLNFLAKNRSEHSETAVNKENDSKIFKEESIDSENEEDEITAYIAKISEFNGEDIETTDEWFENLTTPFNDWTAFKTAFLEQFTNNNTSITLRNCFHNIKQKPSETDKLIKKVCPHAPEDLNSAIQHAKRYEMAMEEANHTKLMNLAIGETSSAAEEKIDQLTKKVKNYFTNQQQQQPQRYQPPQR
ncbi:hypothetical protein G9A89_012518 [Geosiphon pyriformis]|nr:hypothetical protein G9A89_012518 [Geosiphon pyriformis]